MELCIYLVVLGGTCMYQPDIREVYCQLPGNDVHVRPGSGKLMFDRHLGLFFGTIRRQMREVEQPYNNGDLQHVHQTIYLWTIKFA